MVTKEIKYGVKNVLAPEPTVDITVFGYYVPGKRRYESIPYGHEYRGEIEEIIRAFIPQRIRQTGFLSPHGPWKRCFIETR